MQYDLRNAYQREAFLFKSVKLLERGAIIELTEKAFRTSSQNAYLHLLIGVVALETGNTLADTKEWYFKRLCNRDLFCVSKKDKLGNHIEVVRSSADLSKEEMSMAIDRFKKWGNDNHIYMPNPGDDALLKEIAIEMGRRQNEIGG